MWKGKVYLIGGYIHRRQISVVDGCEVKDERVQLQFPLYSEACSQRDNVEVFICFANNFDEKTYKTCQSATQFPTGNFTKLPDSSYSHGESRIAVMSGNVMS